MKAIGGQPDYALGSVHPVSADGEPAGPAVQEATSRTTSRVPAVSATKWASSAPSSSHKHGPWSIGGGSCANTAVRRGWPLGCRSRQRHTERSFWRLSEARGCLLPPRCERRDAQAMPVPEVKLEGGGRGRRAQPGRPCSRTSSSPRLTRCRLLSGPAEPSTRTATSARTRSPRSPSAGCGGHGHGLLSGRLPEARFIRLRQTRRPVKAGAVGFSSTRSGSSSTPSSPAPRSARPGSRPPPAGAGPSGQNKGNHDAQRFFPEVG